MNLLEKLIRADVPELRKYLAKILKSYGYHPIVTNDYVYADGEIPVLLVAHMDTVHTYLVNSICKSSDGVWMSPEGIGGDDRCGLYSVIKIVQELKCHVLFTDREEVGCVGAKAFTESGIKPSVNYIIEFDRKGDNDAVYYDCDNKEFEQYITKFGFKTAHGSCSDISHVAPYIGVSAVNLSSGYYNAHTLHEYIHLNTLHNNIERGKNIIRTDSATNYPYVKKEYKYTTTTTKYNGHSYGYYSDDYYNDYYKNWKSVWGSDKHYDNKDTSNDRGTDDNIIWLEKGDYYIRTYDASNKFDTILECDDYGVDKDGHIYHIESDGTIVLTDNVSLVSVNGCLVSARSTYIHESFWKDFNSK